MQLYEKNRFFREKKTVFSFLKVYCELYDEKTGFSRKKRFFSIQSRHEIHQFIRINTKVDIHNKQMQSTSSYPENFLIGAKAFSRKFVKDFC